eukprot:1174848-Pyramimonas_sp.AAC.1
MTKWSACGFHRKPLFNIGCGKGPYGKRSAAGIYESTRILRHHPNSSHLRPKGSRRIGRLRTKWTESIDHSAVHAEMRTCAGGGGRGGGGGTGGKNIALYAQDFLCVLFCCPQQILTDMFLLTCLVYAGTLVYTSAALHAGAVVHIDAVLCAGAAVHASTGLHSR